MPSELTVRATHCGGMRIDASCGEYTVQLDYPAPAGLPVLRYEGDCASPDGACEGFTPLQLLLASLAGCAGNTMALLLARGAQPVNGIEVTARGTRRDEHPTVLTAIDLEFTIHGGDVDEAAVRRALAVADEQLCPVWAMLKPGTPIGATYTIVPD
jgi:putative redox protein